MKKWNSEIKEKPEFRKMNIKFEKNKENFLETKKEKRISQGPKNAHIYKFIYFLKKQKRL